MRTHRPEDQNPPSVDGIAPEIHPEECCTALNVRSTGIVGPSEERPLLYEPESAEVEREPLGRRRDVIPGEEDRSRDDHGNGAGEDCEPSTTEDVGTDAGNDGCGDGNRCETERVV